MMNGNNAPSATALADETVERQEAPKLKSLKFFYVGLGWALTYPTVACLIGYVIAVANQSNVA